MLSKAKTLKGYKPNAIDEELGEVAQFYFDDLHWTIRYLVADAGTWLTGKQVLISPYAISRGIHHGTILSVELTRKRIPKSPSLAAHLPVSRQFEEAYHDYYGWPMYSNGPHMWGLFPVIPRDRETWKSPTQGEKAWDAHLRNTDNVSGYEIQALDGEIGHVEDFIIDDETWAIRYLVVDTRNWCPGKKVLVSPQWIERVSWSESKVFVDLSGEAIQQSPEYTEESLLTRDYETGLHRHYDRQGYWVADPAVTENAG